MQPQYGKTSNSTFHLFACTECLSLHSAVCRVKLMGSGGQEEHVCPATSNQANPAMHHYNFFLALRLLTMTPAAECALSPPLLDCKHCVSTPHSWHLPTAGTPKRKTWRGKKSLNSLLISQGNAKCDKVPQNVMTTHKNNLRQMQTAHLISFR